MEVVSRAHWKARKPKGLTKLDRDSIRELVVHYSAMEADRVRSHADCAGRVRAMQRFHMTADPRDESKPWWDIAYNWLFCHHGAVFQGRGWDVMSAATLGHNDYTQAICFLGADAKRRDDVTAEGREAAAYLVGKFHGRYGGSKKVVGHRDKSSTKGTTRCPGDELERWVKAKGWETDSSPTT